MPIKFKSTHCNYHLLLSVQLPIVAASTRRARTCFAALFSCMSSRAGKTRLNWFGLTICCQLKEDGSASEKKVSASAQADDASMPERMHRCRCTEGLQTAQSSISGPSELCHLAFRRCEDAHHFVTFAVTVKSVSPSLEIMINFWYLHCRPGGSSTGFTHLSFPLLQFFKRRWNRKVQPPGSASPPCFWAWKAKKT